MRLADVNVGDMVRVLRRHGVWRVDAIADGAVTVERSNRRLLVMARDLRASRLAPRPERPPGPPLRGAILRGATRLAETKSGITSTKRGPALSRPKAPKPVRSKGYLSFVREHPCLFSVGYSRCEGSIEAHHVGKHPMGQKTDDLRCVPLCTRHHGIVTDGLVIADERAPISMRLPGGEVIVPEKLAPDLQSVLRQALVLERGVTNLLVEWIARRER